MSKGGSLAAAPAGPPRHGTPRPPCLLSGARSALGVHLCTPALSPTGSRRAWQPRAHTREVRSRCQCVSHGRPGEEGTCAVQARQLLALARGRPQPWGGAPAPRGREQPRARAPCRLPVHASLGSSAKWWQRQRPPAGAASRTREERVPGARAPPCWRHQHPGSTGCHRHTRGRRRCPRPGHLPMGRASPRRQHGARAPQPRPSQAHTLCPRQGPGLLGDGVGSRTSPACRWGQFLFVTVTESRWAKQTLSSPLQ